MKKIFSLITAFVLAFSAHAQLVTSTSTSLMDVQTPKEKHTTWMFRVGIGTNTMAGDDFDVDSKFGYYLGFEYNREMGKNGAYFGQDFAIASRGYKSESESYTTKLAAHSFQISPLIFGWKIKINDNLSLDPHFGMYYAVDFAGKFTTEFEGESEDTKIGDVEDYFRHDIGVKLGVGIWWNNNYNFDLTYQRGFMSHLWDDVSGGPSNLMFRLGVAL